MFSRRLRAEKLEDAGHGSLLQQYDLHLKVIKKDDVPRRNIRQP